MVQTTEFVRPFEPHAVIVCGFIPLCPRPDAVVETRGEGGGAAQFAELTVQPCLVATFFFFTQAISGKNETYPWCDTRTSPQNMGTTTSNQINVLTRQAAYVSFRIIQRLGFAR